MASLRVQNAGTGLKPFASRGTPKFKPSSIIHMRADAQPRLSIKPAVALTAPVTGLSDDERQKLATELGYRKIGKDVPEGLSMSDLTRCLPSEIFEVDHGKSWRSVLTSVVSFSLGIFLISVSPWYLLPFAWFFAGTAFTGWFVIGHDCGHRSFHKNKLVEDIVGTVMMMPLIFPFEPWRIKHNHHHVHTNKLEEDTAWHPVSEADVARWSPVSAALYKFFLATPLKLWASVGHWLIWHFDLNKYTEKQKPRVMVSLMAVAAFAVIGLPAIVYFTGFSGLFNYWLMPWLFYHFWMSTFTVIQHTAPHIAFKPASEWSAAGAQLGGTVHCDFPRWVEFLCHDINWHVPHHISSKIPWYNLRKATDIIRANWGDYMTEGSFNWRMIKNIVTECHVYDKDSNYKPFDFKKEEPFLAIQRKLLPNSM